MVNVAACRKPGRSSGPVARFALVRASFAVSLLATRSAASTAGSTPAKAAEINSDFAFLAEKILGVRSSRKQTATESILKNSRLLLGTKILVARDFSLFDELYFAAHFAPP